MAGHFAPSHQGIEQNPLGLTDRQADHAQVNITDNPGRTSEGQDGKFGERAERQGLKGGRYRRYSLAERLAARITKPDGPDGCWIVSGYLSGNGGYPQIALDPPACKLDYTHRAAWTLVHGPIPEGQVVCHTCDEGRCANVQHLFLGSPADNVRDCSYKGRRNAFGKQKLQVEEVLHLRRLAALGTPQYRLAAQFGIARNTVSQIVNRVSWGWLPEPGLQNIEPLGQARADFDQLTEQGRRAEVFGA